MLEKLCLAAVARGYHRKSRGRGFQQRHAPAFGARGKYERVAIIVKAKQPLSRPVAPVQLDVRETERGNEAGECGLASAAVDEIVGFDGEFHISRIAKRLMERRQQIAIPFALFKFADHEESKRLAGPV